MAVPPGGPAKRRKTSIVKGKPKSRAGRPTAARVEAINRAILVAAREQFLAAGFDATPMEAVAAAARVSKGTLYVRYPTKESLLRAVVEEQVAVWREEYCKDLPLPDDLRERLLCHARKTMEALGSEKLRAFEKLVWGTAKPTGELAQLLYEAVLQQEIKRIAEDIADYTRNDPVPARNPARVAEMVLATLYGWYRTHQIVRRISAEEARAYAEHAVEVLFAGRAAW
jgi:TetR/AcrR family transcriptional regulator, mexJK operon transcriptional repressor